MAEFISRRDRRIAKLATGDGVFYYNGTAMDHENIPPVYKYEDGSVGTIEKHVRSGMAPAMVNGVRQIHKKGEVKKIPLKDSFTFRGVKYLTDEEFTASEDLAMKLRCLGHFTEVCEDGEWVGGKPRTPKNLLKGKKAAKPASATA